MNLIHELFNLFGLTGRTHGVLTYPLELRAALVAAEVLRFQALNVLVAKWATDCTHISIPKHLLMFMPISISIAHPLLISSWIG